MRVIIVLALLAILAWATTPVILAQVDLDLPRIHEQCNKWDISFGWMDAEDYTRSVSHSTSEAGGIGGAKTTTDTLTLVSQSGFSKIMKVIVIQYPYPDLSLSNLIDLSSRASQAASSSGKCENVTTSERMIDGNMGALAEGTGCKGDGIYYAAVYPLDLRLDGSLKMTTSNGLVIITSTYNRETTEAFLNTIQVDRSV